MTTWAAAKMRLIDIGYSRSSESDKRQLIEIFEEAEKLDVDAKEVAEISPSALRRIILPSREAIKNHDRERLVAVFRDAAKLPLPEFLRKFNLVKLEKIAFKKSTYEGETFYRIDLTERQFDRIKNATKVSFEFIEE